MIKTLTPDDWEIYKTLRLEALADTPEAFGAALEDEAGQDETYFRRFLAGNQVLARFADGQAVGMVGFYVNQGRNLAHRGRMFGMYVQPAHRGKGIGDALMEAVLAAASGQVGQLFCGVHEGFDNALRLYQRHGFVVWGTEPKAVKINGRYLDCHELALAL